MSGPVRVRAGDVVVEVEPGETVLNALLRGGVNWPYSCSVGACLTCASRAVEGTPPAASQESMSEAERARGGFLACAAVPDEDLVVEELY